MKTKIELEITLSNNDLAILNCCPPSFGNKISLDLIRHQSQIKNIYHLEKSLDHLRQLGIITEVYNEDRMIYQTTDFGEQVIKSINKIK